MGAFDIVGFDNNYMRPIFAAQIIFGAGPQSAGSLPMNLLLVGLRTSGGNLTVDSEIRQIFSSTDAITAAGQGSQLYRMALAALKIPNVNIFLAAVTEGGGTAATATIAITGAQTAPGQVTISICDKVLTYSYLQSDSLASIGTGIVNKINGQPDLPVTASGTTTVTLTHRNKGTQGLQQAFRVDVSLASGVVFTTTGSSTFNGDMYFMGAGGTGTTTESVTAFTTSPAFLTKRWARIACAQNDATNAPIWATAVNAQAAATSLLLDQLVFGWNGSVATATTLGQTTLNAVRAQVCAHRNSISHPSELAAYVAALRSATEQTSPVPDYDYKQLAGMPGQLYPGDIYTPAEENTLLNNSVTPITTITAGGNVPAIVRAITSYSLTNAVQDTRTLDIGDASFPDYAALDLQFYYQSVFRPANPLVQDNPAATQLEPPSGVAYPNLWNSAMKGRMATWFRSGWIQDTFSDPTNANAPASTFNTVARRIQSNCPIIVQRIQHQLGQIVRQTAPS